LHDPGINVQCPEVENQSKPPKKQKKRKQDAC